MERFSSKYVSERMGESLGLSKLEMVAFRTFLIQNNKPVVPNFSKNDGNLEDNVERYISSKVQDSEDIAEKLNNREGVPYDLTRTLYRMSDEIAESRLEGVSFDDYMSENKRRFGTLRKEFENLREYHN